MTQPCVTYTEEFISCFVDNELDQDQHDEFADHLNTCTSCAQVEASLRQLSREFNTHVQTQAVWIRTFQPPITLPAGLGRDQGRLPGLVNWFKGSLTIKLASLCAAAILIFFSLYPDTEAPSPSAIVKSVDTNGSSVMIIETPNTQHTIIWFSET